LESKEITIEIEASRGGTLMAFSFIAKGDEIFIQKTENCDLADIDNDYIFECSENLYRIQAEIDY
jgi:hypothetical protein